MEGRRMNRWLSILMACALLVSCVKQSGVEPTYTLTVVAAKEGTKALSLDSSGALKAIWAQGEEVKVYRASQVELLGTLTAQSSGPSTTLSGTISGSFSVGNDLRLEFLSPNYTQQDGKLTGDSTSIDKVCDYATAIVKVTGIDGGTITTEAANFSNRQAIVCFTMKLNKEPVEVNDMSVTVGYPPTSTPSSITISVNPPTPTKDLYVAIPCNYSNTFSFSMQVGIEPFHYNKDIASIELENGKFYHLTVTLP
jgi:hypothetical protein